MYSESDIEAAVATGALTPEAAAALRASVAAGRQAPAVDEESFRLVTGFNDIFVSIAAILLLVAVGWIGALIGGAIVPVRTEPGFGSGMPFQDNHDAAMGFAGGLLVVATSWLLAEYFTRTRRMALPSILLLLVFSGGVAFTLLMVTLPGMDLQRGTKTGLLLMAVGLATAAATYVHWLRFKVPITVAVLTGALVSALRSLVFAVVPGALAAQLWVVLVAGLAVFAFAMWWDMSDRARITRRSDVAFWLHLAAAPMIAHPIFNLLGVLQGDPGIGTALVVLLLYLVFGIVALAVDRRALLVSGLLYVLVALANLFKQAGAVSLNIALTALVIGSALLLLSAFWHPIRRRVVEMLPADLRTRLPELDRPAYVAPLPA